MNSNEIRGIRFYSAFILFIFLLIITYNAFAEVNVIVLPKKQTEPLALYPYELADYIIKVENTDKIGVENLNLKLSVDDELALFDGFTKIHSKVFNIPILEAFGKRELEFKVLLDLDSKKIVEGNKFLINVEYGTESYTHFSGTYLTGTKEPLLISSKLVSSSIEAGEDNAIEFNLENNSSEVINQINAKLLLPSSIYPKGEDSLFFSMLLPKEKVEGNRLEFSTDPLIEDTKHLALIVSYSDSNGLHVIRKDFELAITKFKNYYYMGIIVLIVLIGFLVFRIIKKKKAAKKKAYGEEAFEEGGREEEFEETEAFEENSENEAYESEEFEEEEDIGEESEENKDEELYKEEHKKRLPKKAPHKKKSKKH